MINVSVIPSRCFFLHLPSPLLEVHVDTLAVYTAAHKIKSVSSDHGEDIVSKRQCILEGINIVRSIIRAVYNDDGLAISIPTGEFFHDQDLLIPPLLELDLEDLHKALSELLHSILSCISDNISLPEGMGLEDRSVPRPLLVEQFVDLLHLGLQFLLRTAREERCAILPRKNNRSEDRVSSSGLRSTNVGFYFHLLREALTLLHANKKSHQIIFNDFVNLSFVYVGQRIHYFEFAHSDASDIEHQIQASAQANFERTQSRNVQVSSSDSIRLIEILKFLTMIAPSFHQNISDMNFSKVTDQICPTKKIAKRTQMCKERLQRSMAEIALGYTSETESAESDIILTSPKYQLGSGTIETLGIEEWFKRSLWLLVGWGILQSDISYLPSERGSSLQA